MNSFYYKNYISVKWLEKKLIDRMLKSPSEVIDKAVQILFDLLKEWRSENESNSNRLD